MTLKPRQAPVFVVGSGRSGTTWIGDTIASCVGCIPVFEPMHTGYVREVPRWGRRSGLPGPYLPAEASRPEWQGFFDALLAGRISNHWTRQDWTRVPRLLTRWPLLERIGYRLARMPYQYRERRAVRYVIKEIRANLMLDWLQGHVDGRIVYLIRHPCAVIGSRLRHLGSDPGWEADMEGILGQSRLMADFLEPHRPTIAGATTPLRRQAVLWCVENYVPISQPRSKDWLAFCYEDFLLEPDQTFDRLIRALGLEPTSLTERAEKQIVSSPSPHVRTPKPWHAPLTRAEGEEVLKICEEFGLTMYGRQYIPLCSIRGVRDSARSESSCPERTAATP
jgi:hypothetical protein